MKMDSIKKVAKKTSGAMLDETLEVSKITSGKIAYENAVKLLSPVLPKVKWWQKLFVNKEKKELIEMLIVYSAVHMFKHKFDNYATDSITKYINFKLQDKFLGQFKNIDFENLFNK